MLSASVISLASEYTWRASTTASSTCYNCGADDQPIGKFIPRIVVHLRHHGAAAGARPALVRIHVAGDRRGAGGFLRRTVLRDVARASPLIERIVDDAIGPKRAQLRICQFGGILESTTMYAAFY